MRFIPLHRIERAINLYSFNIRLHDGCHCFNYHRYDLYLRSLDQMQKQSAELEYLDIVVIIDGGKNVAYVRFSFPVRGAGHKSRRNC